MELWIRSQDKKILTKINNLWIMDNQIWMEVPFYENHKKIGLTITGNNHKLAEYKSKERALEVLDEIQNILKPTLIFQNCEVDTNILDEIRKVGAVVDDSKIKQFDTYVYEMPQE